MRTILRNLTIMHNALFLLLAGSLPMVAGSRINATPTSGVRPMVHDAAVYLDQNLALPITGQGDTIITQSGWYVLANDLTSGSVSDDLVINDDYVTLDLNGYTITGIGAGIKINSGHHHINIQNGKIDFTAGTATSLGIYVESSGCNTITIQDLMINEGRHGIGLEDASEVAIHRVIISNFNIGLVADNCSNLSIADCQVLSPKSGGVYLEDCERITIDRTSVLNAEASGFELFKCIDAVCDHCQVLGLLDDEAFAFYCQAGQGVIFQNCTVENVESTSTSVTDQAVGILVSPEQGLPPESTTDDVLGLEHVVRNCTVNRVLADYGAQAYGIRLDFLFPDLPWFCDRNDFEVSPPFNVGKVLSIDWTRDGKYMAAAGEYGVAIYEFDPLASPLNQLVQVANVDFSIQIPAITGPSWTVRWDPQGTDRIIFGDSKVATGSIYLYQFDRSLVTLTAVGAAVSVSTTIIHSVAWGPTGSYVAVGDAVGTINVHAVLPGGIAAAIIATTNRGFNTELWSLDWNPIPDATTGNYYLASAGNLNIVQALNLSEIEVWEFDTSPSGLNLVATNSAEPHGSGLTSVFSISWHPSGDYIAMGGQLRFGGGQGNLNDIRIYEFLPTTPTSYLPGSLPWFTDASKAHNPSYYEEDTEVFVDWEPSGRHLGIGGSTMFDDRLSPPEYVDSRVYTFEPWQGTGPNALPWLYDGVPPHNEAYYPLFTYFVSTVAWTPDGRWFGIGGNEAYPDDVNIRVYKGLFYPKRCLIHENVINNVEAQTVTDVFNAGIEGENVVFPGIGNAMTKNKASNNTRNYGYGIQYVDDINATDHLYNIEFP